MAKLPSYLDRQWNVYHVTLKIPSDVRQFFGKTKFYKSLETDSLEEANIKKLPIIAKWKAQIRVASSNLGRRRNDQPSMLRATNKLGKHCL